MNIQQKQAQQSHEAIVFFRNGAVSKEMLYTEFEALLDCVVPMREFAGCNMEAAYVRMDRCLAVGAAVLFLVPFDDDGFPLQSWNVPLRQLAESSPRGPDLGAGPIRVATRSHCSVPGQENNLWDIQFGVAGDTLHLLQEHLQANRLGLDADEAPAITPTHAVLQNWQASPPMQPAPESADAMLASMQQNSQQLTQMKEQFQREMGAMQHRLTAAQEQLQILSSEKVLLTEQLAAEAQKTRDAREQGERKLQQLVENSRAEQDQIERKLLQSMDKARTEHDEIENRIQELRERARLEREEGERKLQQMSEMNRLQLASLGGDLERERTEALLKRDEQMRQTIERLERERDAGFAEREGALSERDKELRLQREQHARDRQQHEEQAAKLVAEITDLRRDKLRLMGEGMDKFFDALRVKGVKFVSFQPGAGHLTIAMDDLQAFVDDTEAYVARKCAVSVEHYRRWLNHYANPVCQGSNGSGGQCAKPLTKMLKPAEFVGGMHDRCEIHKQVPRSRAAEKAG